jgi:hypothetical protein
VKLCNDNTSFEGALGRKGYQCVLLEGHGGRLHQNKYGAQWVMSVAQQRAAQSDSELLRKAGEAARLAESADSLIDKERLHGEIIGFVAQYGKPGIELERAIPERVSPGDKRRFTSRDQIAPDEQVELQCIPLYTQPGYEKMTLEEARKRWPEDVAAFEAREAAKKTP